VQSVITLAKGEAKGLRIVSSPDPPCPPSRAHGRD